MAAPESVNRLTTVRTTFSQRVARGRVRWMRPSRYDEIVDLDWQSKLVLLLVLPYTAVSVAVEARTIAASSPAVIIWALGLSALLGLVAWRLRSATPAAALTGAVITASLMLSMFATPYQPWRTGLLPVLAVLVLTSLATRFG